MNIKLRLSLQFTLIVAGVLLFFSVLVYYFSYSSQLSKFRQNLLSSANNTATLLINVAEVDSSLLKKIQQSTISWEKEELVITDSALNTVYANNIEYLSDPAKLKNFIGSNMKYFSTAEKDGVFYKHSFHNRSYYVFAMAFDKSRIENLSELRKILLWSILLSTWLSVMIAYLFAKKAIKPISQIIKSVKEINSLKLSTRLDEGDRKDEIAQLAITFNEMLSDLEVAFKNQEEFVSNASHELRTPLTVMISESDYILRHERNTEEYVKHISGLVADLKNMNGLINSLLELAQVNRDRKPEFSNVRIDETVFNAIRQVRNKYQDRKIIPKIQYPDNQNELIIKGDEGLLTVAFRNILDNACKFSTAAIEVEFSNTPGIVNITISDKGIGIPSSELGSVYLPFKRASNVKYIGGFGVGLSLVARIMELHNADFNLQSSENQGTQFKLKFKTAHLVN